MTDVFAQLLSSQKLKRKNMPKLSSHDKLAKLKRFQMTQSGHTDMVKKLQELKEARPGAVKELARARELGDLSENGLYTAAKGRLNGIDSQIFRIEMTLKLADIVEVDSTNAAQIGSKVTVQDGNEKITYAIVGDLEANPKEYKVSPNSPIGKALLGKKVGEDVILHLPAGTKTLKLLSIA